VQFCLHLTALVPCSRRVRIVKIFEIFAYNCHSLQLLTVLIVAMI